MENVCIVPLGFSSGTQYCEASRLEYFCGFLWLHSSEGLWNGTPINYPQIVKLKLWKEIANYFAK
jgi:hypothetical protein